jgi:TRAP-type C4-dicarboxylate transport system substrate-binding protein
MQKKQIFKCISSLLTLTLLVSVLAACGGTGGGSNNAGSGNAVDSNANENTEKVSLIFSNFDPASSELSKELKVWADNIVADSDGMLEIQYYPGATLHAAPDSLQVLKEGGTDIVLVATAFFNEQFTYSELLQLPMLGTESATATQVFWTLYDEYPQAFEKEFEGMIPLMVFIGTAQKLGVNKKVENVGELSGLRIRGASGAITDTLQNWGASPVAMAPPGVYEALQKSVIDGYIFDPAGCVAYNLFELTDYMLDMPIYCVPMLVLMNKEKYESLPDGVKAAIDKNSGMDASLRHSNVIETANAVLLEEVLAKSKTEFIVPTDEVVAEFYAKGAESVIDKWVEDRTTDAIDARAMLDRAYEIIDQSR